MTILLDGARIANRKQLHDQLAAYLPEWYGRNLDALHDCLTDLQEDTVIGVLCGARLAENTGYRRGLRRVLTDASAENPHITLDWCD